MAREREIQDGFRARAPSPVVLIPTPRKRPLQKTANSGNAQKKRRVTPTPSHCSHCLQPLPQLNCRPPQARPLTSTHVPAWRRLGLRLKNEDDRIINQPRATDDPRPIPTPDNTEDDLDDEKLSPEPRADHESSSPERDNENSEAGHGSRNLSTRLRRRRARVSYAPPPMSDEPEDEPRYRELKDDESEDAFKDVSEAESDHESGSDNDAASVSATNVSAVESVAEEEDVIVEPVKKPRQCAPLKQKGKQLIHTSLPPMDNIRDIFKDMATKALGLGLETVVQHLHGRTLNVATMCSGTESPLIALDELSKGLEQLGKSTIRVNHLFSAEIDVLKQGFIERNFQPPKLFRDVREFIPEDANTATTAYGAEEEIPRDADIVVAGFVCKDISRLNNHQKGIDDDGESGDTFRAVYSYTKRFRPKIVLIENVSATTKFWNSFKKRWDAIDYVYEWILLDTKNYYIPQTRIRMYMIAVDRRVFGQKASKVVSEWKTLIEKLKRPCSSPFSAFLVGDNSDQYQHASLASDPDWAMSRLRYDRIRSAERLGIGRPITRWSENGTVRPPDFANRPWYSSQSSRVYDCIDIAHLQGVQKGYDSLYKMAVWDVSQNVDRFKSALGVVPCITPSGMDFVSNRQTPLTGSQLLVLQGMPYNKLLFAKETQKELQDLAGNAMTTTVIGASIVSALIAGGQALGRPTEEQPEIKKRIERASTTVDIKNMQSLDPPPTNIKQLDTASLTQESRITSQLCSCEGNRRLTKAHVHICEDCGHTVCNNCSGNPSHSYVDFVAPQERRQTPGDFENKWRPLLPSRLRFGDFPGLPKIIPHLERSDEKALLKSIVPTDIKSQQFHISQIRRLDNAWRVTYDSSLAFLNLVVSSALEWQLHIKCPHTEPGDSPLRKSLETPLARGLATSSLLDANWEVCIPKRQFCLFQLSASTERTASWKSRLGLPSYKYETVPVHIEISCTESHLPILSGTYKHLPHCGTAMRSLYKKIATNEKPIYLFLDPDAVGPGDQDSFVFSHDCRRLPYGETRICLCWMDPSWRPWDVKTKTSVKVTIPYTWIACSAYLETTSPSLSASIPSTSSLKNTSLSDCTKAVTLLDVRIKEKIQVQKPLDLLWLLEDVKKRPNFTSWQKFDGNFSQKSSCTCSPPFPKILWSIDNAGSATAREDRKAAANFERAVKTRSPIIIPEHSFPSNATTRIQVGVNITSLVHRARMRLEGAEKSAWRLITDHTDPAPERFPHFQLQRNAVDTLPYSGPLRLQYELLGEQKRSLSWMKNQEEGRNITLVEVEEAVHRELGWRVEAKAERIITVQGGVLADLPSFGKTVTTIALINSEFEEHSPENILAHSKSTALINLAATLIICPAHIAKQWESELQDCLGSKLYQQYNVRIIERYSDLRELSVQDFRDSRIIVVSWSVFADETYIAQLAACAALPPPATTRGRPYDTWLEYVSQSMPHRVDHLLTLSTPDFEKKTHDLICDRLNNPNFMANVPLKTSHGSAYVSYKKMQAAKVHKTAGSSAAQKSKKLSGEKLSGEVPLFQLFNFNRVVVDEYHYLYDGKHSENFTACSAIKQLSASKRWILSGTPALTNFSDVNQIASFLGLKLGRDQFGDGRTQLEKRLMAEQTSVEKFLSCSEIMSYQWHQARHQRAQNFLNDFVRQNEPLLKDIKCSEYLMPIELGVAHHAVYLELCQHLISQRMQLKRPKTRWRSDKVDRLNASLNNSATAEEALLKRALVFQTEQGKSGLDLLINTRYTQRREVQADVLKCAKTLKKECLRNIKQPEEDFYLAYKRDIESGNILGDDKACQVMRKIFSEVEKTSSSEKRTKTAKDSREVKTTASNLSTMAEELTHRLRSERFIKAIRQLLPVLATRGDSVQHHECSASNCQGVNDVSRIFLISHCGHMACERCLAGRNDSEACVHKGCKVPVEAKNLIQTSHIGSSDNKTSEGSFGKKLDDIVDLLKTISSSDDQAIVFVPNEEVSTAVEEALGQHDVSYATLDARKAQAARTLEEFKTNKDPKTMKKVLILDLSDESAAGANLVNANHVIFVSPLLSKSQYGYDSAMAQAIARCRRYRQKKTVYIYHFAALRTIDVDILEHRHKRFDVIQTRDSEEWLPATLSELEGTTKVNNKGKAREQPQDRIKEKTKMVRNRNGVTALVPVSMLRDETFRETNEVDDNPETFTSLINFAETLDGGDNE
ncbi:hypothetical protein P280DRAFT_550182 [Massarina eburnea CBS 473.64]|uniref:Helicase C-terminal domain-containing protein n=1 Tax=Massarina eburnea CBS 473.64 TaxID=1395130 RepID=A0A6A6RXZ3_9PLEO|nr:hypothetical protein P280DRAFT_550182 [Massarina eburnea CBS 473.64]